MVIVDDNKVKTVEYGYGDANDNTTAPSRQTLSKNNTNNITSLQDKRWIGKLTSDTCPVTGSSLTKRVYVKITAEDNSVQVYRYRWYIPSLQSQYVPILYGRDVG